MPETQGTEIQIATHMLYPPIHTMLHIHNKVYQKRSGEGAGTGRLCTVLSSSHYPKLKWSRFFFGLGFFAFFLKLGRAGTEVLPMSALTRATCTNWGKTSENSLQKESKITALTASLPINWLHLRFATITTSEFHHL